MLFTALKLTEAHVWERELDRALRYSGLIEIAVRNCGFALVVYANVLLFQTLSQVTPQGGVMLYITDGEFD